MRKYNDIAVILHNAFVPPNTPESAPLVSRVNVLQPWITKLWIYTTALGTNLRIKGISQQIFPVSGYIPATTSYVEYVLERVLQGPPFEVTIEAYNTSGTSNLLLVVALNQAKEDIDVDNKILATIQDISKGM